MMDIIDKFEAEFGNPNKLDFFARKCWSCGQGMNFGYIIYDGGSACSKKCLIEEIGQERFDEEMAIIEDDTKENNWDFDWTHWEDLADACSGNDGYYNSKGDIIECSDEEIKKILVKSNYFSDWLSSPAWNYRGVEQ